MLELVLVTIMLHLNLVTSQSSIATPGTSWVINGSTSGMILTAPGRTPPITLGFTSPTCMFSCSVNDDDKVDFYLSIFLPIDNPDLSSREIFNIYYPAAVAWRASPQPVQKGAYLTFTTDGDLVLTEVDGVDIWSTSTTGAVFMEMESSGNLVLRNNSGNVLWQSFDHPSDGLLPRQPLRPGMKLVASVSNERKEPGYFWLEVSRFSVAINSSLASYGELWSSDEDEISFLVLVNSTLEIHGRGGVMWSSSVLAPVITETSGYQLLKIYPNGELRLITLKQGGGQNASTVSLSSLFLNKLPPPTCGVSFSKAQGCVCPSLKNSSKSLEHVVYGGLERCKPREEPRGTCVVWQNSDMIEVQGHYYYTLNINSSRSSGNLSSEECKALCLKNCSCKAILIQESTRTCFQMSQVLTLNKLHNSALVYSIKWYNGNLNVSPSTSRFFALRQKKKTKLLIVVVLSVATFGIIILAVLIWKKKIDAYLKRYGPGSFPSGAVDAVRNFTYMELHTATQGFRKKIGSGGFGTVFEGILPTGSKVAVKRLDNLSTQGYRQFKTEVRIIGSIHHKNLVRLVGFCSQASMHFLVYEFVENGSLDKWIYKQDGLDWDVKLKVLLEVARGIAYLHDECATKVLHLDIKPQNILLDEDFGVKIADFGLSRMVERGEVSNIVTMIRGTPGYMAPEWLQMRVSDKMDVYSFGIVVLEVVTGMQAFRTSGSCFLAAGVITNLRRRGKVAEIDRLKQIEADKLLGVGEWCIQGDPQQRPSMREVVKVLEGSMQLPLEFS